jgi:hypothetical protein
VNANSTQDPIPQDVAQQLCREVRTQNRGRWYSAAWWQCWGCTTFTHNDEAKMCYFKPPAFRGCNLVNARYDRQRGSTGGRTS